MSVLVTTTFSQGAVFYAGETLSCTIAFTNTTPVLSKPPSASSSLTRQNRHTSPPPRNGSSYTNNSKNAKSSHSRSPSASFSQDAIPPSSSTEMDTTSFSSFGKSASLSSLASSTLAYFTGYSSSTDSTPPIPPSNTIASNAERHTGGTLESTTARETKWERQGDSYNDYPNGNSDPLDTNDSIAIELGSHAANTPRTSIDTLASSYTHPISASRRSSIDSLASSSSPVHPYYMTPQFPTGQHHPTHHRRLSRLLKSPTTPSLMKKPENLIWGFAQVVGQFVVDPTLINNNEFAPLKQRTMYRPQGTGFGGGGGLWNGKQDSKFDTRSTPVFSTPPSILFVDLDLTPGETKKYSYKIKLPNDLPPSHRGKSIRFNYYLVVGTQRGGSTSTVARNGGIQQQQGQVVQLRFRVLNHVSEDGSRPIYDLMNPVVVYKDEAQVELIQESTNKAKRSGSICSIASANSTPLSPLGNDYPHQINSNDHYHHQQHQQQLQQTSSSATPETVKKRQLFMDYVNELLEKSANGGHDDIQEITRRESDAYDEQQITQNDDGGDEIIMTEHDYRKTCAQVVTRITHLSRKAMYDLCKNNQRVAKLQLTKVAHRLGEPILGILNFGEATLSTYKVSIFLESQEIVESSISLRQPQYIARVSRKSHSEFHTFCLNNHTLAFSLPIPTTASPEFQTTGVKLQYHLKFEFITTNQSRPSNTSTSYLSINTDERHHHYQSKQQVQVSTFDCQIPIKVYGSPNGSDRATYGRPHTFPVH
ncbi:Rgp1-domain-containing protein [Chlamydoabsidia padenii]|nr:Rgp1-domain-containing protein [Chlamydoabsidia padenii]